MCDMGEYITNLVRHIENNLSFELDTIILSHVSYVSVPKLYRDFYNLTGHSVKEYIRKRRLSNALALLKTSNMELMDIALSCGYSSHQALCRVVKQALNLTPSEYKNENIYYFFPPFSGQSLQSVTVKNEKLPQTLRLLYYNSKITNIENTAVSAFLRAFPNYSGRIFGKNGKQKGNKFCYELFINDEIIDPSLLRGNFQGEGFEITHHVPATHSMFAASVVQNDEPKINAAWDFLYHTWLQYSMFEYTDEPYFEEYIIKNAKPVKLKLFLPIKKRVNDMKISLIDNPQLSFITAKAKGNNAEKIASEAVIEYLSKNHPYMVNTTKNLFIQKGFNSYVCGVEVYTKFQIMKDENIMLTTIESDNYLVLENSIMGDYDKYADMLYSFAVSNGMNADKKGIFAVYNMDKGINNLSVKMYCPVKINKKSL